jgi:hypothetical protein
MKMIKFVLISTLALLMACQSNTEVEKKVKDLSHKVDSLEKIVEHSYKPGLGVIMNRIQRHHQKLWKSGVGENWDLAKFELHELEERFEEIEDYHAGDDETQQIKMIYGPIEQLEGSVKSGDKAGFVSNFETLTATCNSCHQLNEHPFVRIVVPNEKGENQQFSAVK